MELKVLLVEDDAAVSRSIAQAFRLEQIAVDVCTSVEQALPLISDPTVGAVVSDVRLPGQDGFAMLAAVRQFDTELPIVVITAYAHIALAIQAIREGAYDFIEKPFSADRLVDVVRRALEKRRLVLDNRLLRDALRERDGSLLIGHSSAIERARQRVAALADIDVDILINGETGTGKEVIARALHDSSERKGHFVAINCGAIPESVFDSEVFGHEAGSFTGAQKRRIGKIEHANHGTLFLDEIENMPLAMQVKFLRVLQERKLERLGSNDLVPVSFRVVAATKESLRKMSDEGKFRSDLYYRLNVVTIDMPALRDRREDIPVLLQHFARMAGARFNRPLPAWTPGQLRRWMEADWPGNVRELRNFADRLVLGIGEDTVNESAAIDEIAASANAASLSSRVNAFERQIIDDTLKQNHGSVAKAAEALHLPKKTLYDKLRKHRIEPARE
ncbi:sigma-54 dependent transcriptional regulator [Variovorax guangxiensis]|uniref:sigma-54-dependent transcriptional regulator n=1 Tax=Variovorax guangxiensis TaxID=1775474 RepID=UPI00285BA6CA|nr:sigma-54 dependent transcriptional regulator [Variovorax guangxiensis]MDR6860124.1 two-component system C4-dicarboxylate transport response regulator DctD [Variovorax guangxiensis]